MIIREVHIIRFGKIENKTYTFSKGINVIYGENEAGKTTIQQFIKAMLFGLEKKRGRMTEADAYGKYEPWDAPAYFAGSLIFETGGQRFLLERNFYHKEATVRLVNMNDLEELSVEKGDLQMLLGGITKSAYENTYCVGQDMLRPQETLATLLADEKANLTQTQDGSFSLSNALDLLGTKKKQMEKQRKELEVARMNQVAQLRSQAQLLEGQMDQLGEKLQAHACKERLLEQQMRESKAQESRLTQAEETPVYEPGASHRQDRRKQWNPLVIIGVIGAILMQVLISMSYGPTKTCRTAQIVFGILIVIGIVWAIRKNTLEDAAKELQKQKERNAVSMKQRELQDVQKECYMEYRGVQSAKEALKQELQEQEVQYENNKQQQEELMMAGAEEVELLRQIDAITLAADTMGHLAVVCGEESDDYINGRMSQILSVITAGKYDALSLSAGKQLMLTENYHQRKPEQYSQATSQQMYFAYRMAAGEMLAKEEPLPFLFDEAFASYDEVRLKEVLSWLATQERQALIFTCRRLESGILQELGVSFAEIAL